MDKRGGTIGLVLFLVCGGVVSCTTPLPRRTESVGERISRDSVLLSSQRQAMSARTQIVQSSQIDKEMNRIAQNMIENHPDLKSLEVRVKIFRSNDKLRVIYFPGTEIWLNIKHVAELAYENELAACLALYLAHILRRHYMDSPVREENLQESYGRHADAIPETVKILYLSGYDPRGLASYWVLFARTGLEPEYPLETVKKLQIRTHAEISNYTPLRNPVVSSKKFSEFIKKVRSL